MKRSKERERERVCVCVRECVCVRKCVHVLSKASSPLTLVVIYIQLVLGARIENGHEHLRDYARREKDARATKIGL